MFPLLKLSDVHARLDPGAILLSVVCKQTKEVKGVAIKTPGRIFLLSDPFLEKDLAALVRYLVSHKVCHSFPPSLSVVHL